LDSEIKKLSKRGLTTSLFSVIIKPERDKEWHHSGDANTGATKKKKKKKKKKFFLKSA